MSAPYQVTLTPIVQGDTWDGLQCSFSSDGTAFADDLSLVRFQFQDEDGTSALTLSSAVSGEVTINDAANWTFTVEPRIISIEPGTYSIGIETTDSAGIKKTRIAGTIEIIPDPVI